ncbi:uncharacterized protein LOC133303551 [Gastrolobium bilobum]|uniref:uncharacterized protein LOC133303551 n=1 Tax=Gastrolobium bilobum TaxID=150636 RepID=UPI002AB26A21|nr:uncharacterized protein LOC133303551 [Gastrolobium bilobum]
MGLNKLGTAITVITAITLAALAAEIIYVVWRRRQMLRPRVRVEPQEASLQSSSSSTEERERELELELEQQVMKLQCLYGPSRVLFTIKEEEREGLDSENGSSAECSAVKNPTAVKTSSSFSEAMAVDEVAVSVEELLVLKETTPFSTPCASPPYYTPNSSPTREAFKDNNVGNG